MADVQDLIALSWEQNKEELMGSLDNRSGLRRGIDWMNENLPEVLPAGIQSDDLKRIRGGKSVIPGVSELWLEDTMEDVASRPGVRAGDALYTGSLFTPYVGVPWYFTSKAMMRDKDSEVPWVNTGLNPLDHEAGTYNWLDAIPAGLAGRSLYKNRNALARAAKDFPKSKQELRWAANRHAANPDSLLNRAYVGSGDYLAKLRYARDPSAYVLPPHAVRSATSNANWRGQVRPDPEDLESLRQLGYGQGLGR